MVNRLTRFALLVLIAREVMTGEYGVWVLAVATATICANLCDFGLGTVVATRVAALPSFAPQYVRYVLAISLVVVSLATLILLALVQLLGLSHLVAWLAFGGVCECVAFLLLSPQRALGELRPEAGLRLMQALVLALLGGAILAIGRTELLVVPFITAGLGSVIYAVVAVGLRFDKAVPEFNRYAASQLARGGVPVFASSFVFLLYFRADAYLLTMLKGSSATAIYGAAYNVALGLAFVPLMLGRALLPRLAAHNETAGLRREFLSSASLVVRYAAATTCLLLLAAPVVLVAYGGSYGNILAPYLMLSLVQGVYFITHLGYTLLYARSRNGAVVLLTMITLCINVAANLLLIPSLGPAAPPLAMLASELALLVMQLILIAPLLNGRHEISARPLAAEGHAA